MTPGVSIVVPTYNAAEFVHRSLQSVLELDYPAGKLELIIVDDGSVDDTIKVARKIFSKAKLDWRIIKQEHKGPSAARNNGWSNAKYDWVQFLDADDCLSSAKLRLQGPMAAQAKEDIAVVYSPWTKRRFDQPAESNSELHFPDLSGDTLLRLLTPEGFLMTGCQLYRRSWLQRIGGFDTTINCIEDVDLDLRLAMSRALFLPVVSDSAVSVYLSRDGSLSKNKRDFIDGCLRNAKMVEKFWRDTGAELGTVRIEVLMSIYSMSLRYYAGYDLASFRQLYDHVLNLQPGFKSTGTKAGKLFRIFGSRTEEVLAARVRRILGR